MGAFSIWHWLIVLLVVVLLFGTKKLRNLGGDLGGAVRGFKQGMKEATQEDNAALEAGATTAESSAEGKRKRRRFLTRRRRFALCRMFGISFWGDPAYCNGGFNYRGAKALPETARFIGHLFSRVHRQVNSVKADIRARNGFRRYKKHSSEYEDATKNAPRRFSASGGTYGQRSGRFTQKNACNGYD